MNGLVMRRRRGYDSLLRFSHRVGRCRWIRTRAAVMAPIGHGSRVMHSSALQVRLSSELARSAGARTALISWLRVRLSGARLGPLVGP